MALKVERPHPESDVVNVIADKVRRRPVKPFAGLFSYENLGDDLIVARYWGTVPQLKKDDQKSKRGETKDAILDLLEGNQEFYQSAIVEELEEIAARATVLKYLKELISEGKITEREGDNGRLLYRCK